MLTLPFLAAYALFLAASCYSAGLLTEQRRLRDQYATLDRRAEVLDQREFRLNLRARVQAAKAENAAGPFLPTQRRYTGSHRGAA